MAGDEVSLREAPYPGVAALYFAAYLAYLFYSLESELGVIGGLILGAVYLKSGRNLLAPAIVHAFINAFPATTIIRFGSG